MTLSYIDSHCHLDNEFISEGITALLEACQGKQVTSLIYPASTYKSNLSVVEYAKKYPMCYGLIGLHPHDAKDFDQQLLTFITQHAISPGIVGIGEIGLDFYYKYSEPEQQKRVFSTLLDLSIELQKPVQIHVRDAFNAVISILKQKSLLAQPGLIHCFTGDPAQAEAFLELGFNISFSGIVTFKNAFAVKEACQRVPLDRLHLETDTPFLAPAPYRGKPNRPYYIEYIAAEVAKLKDISLDELMLQVNLNTAKLFKLKKSA